MVEAWQLANGTLPAANVKPVLTAVHPPLELVLVVPPSRISLLRGGGATTSSPLLRSVDITFTLSFIRRNSRNS